MTSLKNKKIKIANVAANLPAYTGVFFSLRIFVLIVAIVIGSTTLIVAQDSSELPQNGVGNTQSNTETKPQVDADTVEKQLEEILALSKDDGFEYRREDRPDPFAPFISEKTINAERRKALSELTGLQRVEPGQLTLVAVIFKGKTATAMVQDSGGMGYLIRKGMEIGLTGVVDAITPNSVIIKQSYKTISGKNRYRTLEMILKKEGEK